MNINKWSKSPDAFLLDMGQLWFPWIYKAPSKSVVRVTKISDTDDYKYFNRITESKNEFMWLERANENKKR